MRGKLIFASTLTLGILISFVFFIVLLASYSGGYISAPMLIIFTIVINLIMWLVSPAITDFLQKMFYKYEKIELSDLEKRSPYTARFLKEACERNGIKIPMLRIINDLNPTAYCFGSYPGNSRLVVSEGIFHYLNEEEVAAVYGHELGHIKNLDFIVMTIANTLLMILYEMYVIFTRTRIGRGKNNPLPLIGLVSLIFWWIGTYVVLYLSRTREYMADRFSGIETGNPNALSTALVKIAYGIAAQPDTEQTKRLLASTRALGISDYKNADNVGSMINLAAGKSEISSREVPAFDPRRVSRVFLFDIFNPWAKIVQLGSTHPLTGLRIKALMDLSGEMGKIPTFNFDEITLDGASLDRRRLYGKFYLELIIYFAPLWGLILGLLMAISNISLIGAPVLGLGLGLLVKGIYRYPPLSAPKEATVLELMSDPYASPLKGKPVILQGTAIGKANAGSYFGEDLVIHDPSGGLMTLNYESIIPVFGNLYFGLKTAKKIITQRVEATGWFRRKVYQLVDLKSISTESKKYSSFTRFQALFWGFVITTLGILSFFIHFVPIK